MGTYVKSYKTRIRGVLISILSIISAMLICSLLFGNKVNRISSQLESYSISKYSHIYKMNYPLGHDDEYIYADTNIAVFLDNHQTTRLPTVVLMQNELFAYDASTLGYSNELRSDEAVITRNIADDFRLSVGDKIYALYPHTNEIASLTLVAIADVNYDFENPDVDNRIGIAILGYNEQYDINSENKSLCFSNESLSADISEHPQILDSIFSKNSNYEYVFNQGVHILVIEAIMLIAAFVVSEIFFYRYSCSILRRLYLKGLPRKYLKIIPFIEHLVMTVIPTLIAIIVRAYFIPVNSGYIAVLCAIDIVIAIIYSFLFGFQPFRKTRYRVR